MLVYHFYNRITDKKSECEPLTIQWYECLLKFVTLYGANISDEQKQLLFDLIKKQPNPKFTNEIKERLNEAQVAEEMLSDGDAAEEPMDMDNYFEKSE